MTASRAGSASADPPSPTPSGARPAAKSSTDAKWSPASDDKLCAILDKYNDGEHRAGTGWKPTVWQKVANRLAGDLDGAGPKTKEKCKSRWHKVSIFLLRTT